MLLFLATLGCDPGIDSSPIPNPMYLGGKVISIDELTVGRDMYVRHCAACHGIEGDGRGPSSPGLRPPPRDFRTGMYKFMGVVDGLPHDDDFLRVIEGGLHGTAMWAWDVPDGSRLPIVHWIKQFVDEGNAWKDWEEPLGERMIPTSDPWAADADDGIARGKEIFHGSANCASCHPAYATRSEIWDINAAIDKRAEYRDNMYYSESKESDYMVEGVTVWISPPDFTWDHVRSVFSEETRKEDLYRTIAAGIGGTAMPTWKGVIAEEDLWALVYYVDSLIEIRDTEEAIELRASLTNQAAFVPPAAEEEVVDDTGDTAE